MVTIKDVAREAGVAISTVSNVFNNGDIVSEETKQKVLEAEKKRKGRRAAGENRGTPPFL